MRAGGKYDVLLGMFENSQRYTTGQQAAQAMATCEVTLLAVAKRHGVSVGVIRTIMHLGAMRASGVQVGAAQMAESELATRRTLDKHLAEAKRAGWVTSSKGRLHVTSSGRQVVADVARGWERAARKLVAFSSALPFRKRAAKRQDDQA